jgi:peptidoglycan/xylan/chitin deacetylase (PgdA/CDA1 family)
MRRSAVAVAIVLPALLAAAAAWLAAALRPRDIPVLMYHNVLPDEEATDAYKVSVSEFARQMDELAAAGYRTVLPDDIYLASHGRRPLPRKPVVVTFDDGYLGVKDCAEPVLARHGFRAICYAVTARLGGEGDARASFDSGPLLSTNEAAAMAARGVVALGSHSRTHRPNPRSLAGEIPASRYELRRLTGAKTRDYSYPHGLYGYPEMYEALRRGKFRTAVVCEDRMFRYGTETNLLAIPRLTVYGGPHSVRVESVDPGTGTIVLANDGAALPLKAVVRDALTGRIRAESGVVRIGGGASEALRVPPEAFEGGAFRIEARDKAGLFNYLTRE